MKKLIFLLFIIFFSASLYSQQTYRIEGKQIKLDQNLKFKGKAVYIPVNCKIFDLKGDFTSFSLRLDNNIKYQFYYNQGEFDPKLDSIIIEPGMYFLYPDLPPNTDSIRVEIFLKPLN